MPSITRSTTSSSPISSGATSGFRPSCNTVRCYFFNLSINQKINEYLPTVTHVQASSTPGHAFRLPFIAVSEADRLLPSQLSSPPSSSRSTRGARIPPQPGACPPPRRTGRTTRRIPTGLLPLLQTLGTPLSRRPPSFRPKIHIPVAPSL
jgi:hypothetical protein